MRSVFMFSLLGVLTASGLYAETGLPVETLAYQSFPEERVLEARVEAVHKSTVSAQTSGRIQEILFDVDDFVPKDAVLLKFTDKEQRARAQSAEAELRTAQAAFELAEQEYQRVESIYARKLVAKAALDKAVADRKSAEARLNAARARVTEAREQLDYTQVRAPFSGILTQRHVEVGETANPGTPLMTGLSLENLRLEVDLPQSLVHLVRQQLQARVLLGAQDSIAIDPQRVVIFPYAEPNSHTFRARMDLNGAGRGLYPGMLVKLAITTGESRRLTVPQSALVYRSEVTAVYVQDAQGMHMRHVRTGREAGARVEVVAGLREGEQVITDALQASQAIKAQALEAR